MTDELSIEIAAPVERIWAVLTDVERWPEWTASMDRLGILGDGPLGEGTRVRIEQPRLPALVWTVTEVQPPRSFTWRAGRPGLQVVAGHLLSLGPEGTVTLTLRLEQTGPLARLLAPLSSKRTRRYMAMEAEGLKRRCEAVADP